MNLELTRKENKDIFLKYINDISPFEDAITEYNLLDFKISCFSRDPELRKSKYTHIYCGMNEIDRIVEFDGYKHGLPVISLSQDFIFDNNHDIYSHEITNVSSLSVRINPVSEVDHCNPVIFNLLGNNHSHILKYIMYTSFYQNKRILASLLGKHENRHNLCLSKESYSNSENDTLDLDKFVDICFFRKAMDITSFIEAYTNEVYIKKLLNSGQNVSMIANKILYKAYGKDVIPYKFEDEFVN